MDADQLYINGVTGCANFLHVSTTKIFFTCWHIQSFRKNLCYPVTNNAGKGGSVPDKPTN